jgi:hypothetical protein
MPDYLLPDDDNVFGRFINDELDLSGVGENTVSAPSSELPPKALDAPEEWFRQMPFTPQRSPVDVPTLDDPRWINGKFQVEKDLEIYHQPYDETWDKALRDACQMTHTAVRYIPNIVPGWSAIYMDWADLLGFVRNKDVKLYPVFQRSLTLIDRRASRWFETVVLALLALLFLTLLANRGQIFNNAQHQIQALEVRITEQQSVIADLQATIEALDREAFNGR